MVRYAASDWLNNTNFTLQWLLCSAPLPLHYAAAALGGNGVKLIVVKPICLAAIEFFDPSGLAGPHFEEPLTSGPTVSLTC